MFGAVCPLWCEAVLGTLDVGSSPGLCPLGISPSVASIHVSGCQCVLGSNANPGDSRSPPCHLTETSGSRTPNAGSSVQPGRLRPLRNLSLPWVPGPSHRSSETRGLQQRNVPKGVGRRHPWVDTLGSADCPGSEHGGKLCSCGSVLAGGCSRPRLGMMRCKPTPEAPGTLSFTTPQVPPRCALCGGALAV